MTGSHIVNRRGTSTVLNILHLIINNSAPIHPTNFETRGPDGLSTDRLRPPWAPGGPGPVLEIDFGAYILEINAFRYGLRGRGGITERPCAYLVVNSYGT